VFERNLTLLDSDMNYADGHYRLPQGPGLGVSPNERFWQHAELVT
jgi:galactonate dehydratase